MRNLYPSTRENAEGLRRNRREDSRSGANRFDRQRTELSILKEWSPLRVHARASQLPYDGCGATYTLRGSARTATGDCRRVLLTNREPSAEGNRFREMQSE